MIPLRQLSWLFLGAAVICAAALALPALAAPLKAGDGWTQLFNGKDFSGWKIPMPPSGSFKGVKETKNDDGKVIAFIGVGVLSACGVKPTRGLSFERAFISA